nr:MAG TPA: hypothetical protein [Caudoviricetes sp.]
MMPAADCTLMRQPYTVRQGSARAESDHKHNASVRQKVAPARLIR